MYIRRYKSADCMEILQLFYNTVHTINAGDYNEEQLNVWATGKEDMGKWNQSLLEHYSLVAIKDGIITGFGDIDNTGYLDRLFVHKDYQGQGIATIICNKLEQSVDTDKIVTHASVTAKPFFENRGYKKAKEQQIERGGVFLTNYVMEKHK